MRSGRRFTWIHLWILLAAGAFACKRAEPENSIRNEIPERYRFLWKGGVADSEVPALLSKLPFDRIELSEFSTWTWERPTITLERDGAISVSNPKPKTGAVSIFEYGELCYLIERVQFETLKPRYAINGYDFTTYTVKVWRTGEKEPITVEDYGSVGPADLWTLRAAIQGVAAQAHWN